MTGVNRAYQYRCLPAVRDGCICPCLQEEGDGVELFLSHRPYQCGFAPFRFYVYVDSFLDQFPERLNVSILCPCDKGLRCREGDVFPFTGRAARDGPTMFVDLFQNGG